MKTVNFKDLNNSFFETIEYDSMPDIDKIIKNVQKDGDEYLIQISKKFKDGDFKTSKDFLVTKAEIKKAYKSVSKEFIESITIAKNNVENFAKSQLFAIKNIELNLYNSSFSHKAVPVEKVLAYIPGGNYPLPSSCIMTVVPAKVAGVKEIIVTSPKILPETIVAADIAGANKIYKLGGAQAIAAFAYGTKSIEPVDKIVGPGNKYVTYAKKSVFGKVGIDFLAGPSEVLIIADKNANPDLIAADMLAQSEHDKDARAYLITNSAALAKNVEASAQKFLKKLKTKKIASEAFENACAIIVKTKEQAVEIANKKAPEHLEIMVDDEEYYKSNLTNYGSLFIGENCAEVLGDYVSGTNHVLPTNRAARYTGGLSVYSYLRILTSQKLDADYSKSISKTASYLAECEGLMAHKLASDLRGNV